MRSDTHDEPCPYCGEDDCEDSCTAARLDDETVCIACAGGDHARCGMQTWCRCPCAGPEADHAPSLGACCICGEDGPQVRVLLMLNARCPQPGKGWGCLTCGLSANGALAVVCDSCAAPYERQERFDIEEALRWVCRGTPGTDGRLPIAALRGEHGHDRRKHPELPQVPPLQLLPTDTRFGWHAEEGPGCRCSRCGQTIWDGVIAIRAYPEHGDWAYRYHPTCLGASPTDEDPYSDEDQYADDPSPDATPTQEDAPDAPRSA